MRPNTVIVSVTQANLRAVTEWLARETPTVAARPTVLGAPRNRARTHIRVRGCVRHAPTPRTPRHRERALA